MALWLSPLLLEMEMELFISSLRMPAFMFMGFVIAVLLFFWNGDDVTARRCDDGNTCKKLLTWNDISRVSVSFVFFSLSQ
jgi:heme/copper-type cytochrome/quinol oxidase subunit 1